MGFLFKIFVSIIAAVNLIPRVWAKLKEEVLHRKIKNLKTDLFDSQAEKKYTKATKNTQASAAKQAREKELEDISDYFNS